MEDKERISISILPSQLDKLNAEQDKEGVSSRSDLVRKIFDEYFKIHQPDEGRELVMVYLPMGLVSEMRLLLNRRDQTGKKNPLFIDEQDMVLHSLRLLLKEYGYYLKNETG